MTELRSHCYTIQVKLPQNAEFWPVLVELDTSPSACVGMDARPNKMIQRAANGSTCEQNSQTGPSSDGSSLLEGQTQSNPGRCAVSFLVPDSHQVRIEKLSQDGPAVLNVERLERIIRKTDLKYQLFQSEGDFPLQSPPDLSKFQWTAVPFDVYYHKSTGEDAKRLWIWAVDGETCQWKSVEEGFECRGGAFAGRFLVLTQQQGPSWVSASTVQRTYTHLLTAVAKLEKGRT